ncbi:MULTISPECIES: nuclear transport factor 2 family protein [unclassified Sphingomonas]|uniref:nuclear transport factor 2 family protein n=1 Tax=unclassified Sphingomonas TaxID=196159 RepID=UPI0002885833|nr:MULTISPECIES: nuclear transport factor 2 family protein [unclassified Sphingomonas]
MSIVERELANPQVEAAAVGHPDIAAVLGASDAADQTLVSGDKAAFLAVLAPDCTVNTPGNRVAGHAQIAAFFDQGLIHYRRYHKRIEHLARYGDAHVVMMGEETYVPHDGTATPPTVSRRFTDLWRRDGDRWVIALRQATIYKIASTDNP